MIIDLLLLYDTLLTRLQFTLLLLMVYCRKLINYHTAFLYYNLFLYNPSYLAQPLA